jgi:hypothetical protein
MTDFITALTTNDVLTENGMPTHSTAGKALVDLFFKMGGARALTADTLRTLFAQAFGEDALLATKTAFYSRDVRGGQGERQAFRVFYRYLCEVAPAVAEANLSNVPFYGRWDDLFVAIGTPVEKAALGYYELALGNGDKLAAKWAPREGKRDHALANALRRFMKLSWQEYRQLLAGKTEVVESRMCNREFSAINYSHVPSIAIKKYRKAFFKRDGERYGAWVAELTKAPELRAAGVKVNASAIFPHDIVSAAMNHSSVVERQAVEAQWAALPNYMPEGRRVLPVCDVSGSMEGQPMDVCVALGLYCAERNIGPFHNAIITFSATPSLHVVKAKDLPSRVQEVMDTPWGMNTNLEAMFRLVLDKAVAAKLPADAMPDTLLIFSDMQFDACVTSPSDNALTMIDRMYAAAGYERPNVVFWNLRTSSGVPVKHTTQGTALVSGFSPSILKSVLAGSEMTPLSIVLKTLNGERYERVVA